MTLRLSRILARLLAEELQLSNDKEEVLAYGAFGLIQVFLSLMLVTIFGALLNVLLEAIIISIIAAALRKFSGGAHSSSPTGCLLIGTFFTILLALGINKFVTSVGIEIVLIYTAFCIIFSFAAIYKYAPVDHPNKRIKREEKRQKLKMESFVFTGCVSFISTVLLTIYVSMDTVHSLLVIALSLVTGMMWQTFTLVKTGRKVLAGLDTLIEIPIKIIGGEKT